MPGEYSGITNEHMTVRNHVGLFDVSHMGDIWVQGKNALAFLQYVTTNDVSLLNIRKVQYSCFPNGKGGIVDDLLVYKYDNDKYLLIVNASNITKDWNWLVSQNTFGAELENSSDEISQLALQGPESTALLQKLTPISLADIPYYSFKVGELAGMKDVIISNTGYTGAGGYEIYFHNQDGINIWNAIIEAGEQFGLKPVGLGARDTLRLEMGYNLYGHDINDTTSPIEAGLSWITKFNKDFIDKDLLLKQKNEGTAKKLTGFILEETGIPRQHYPLVDQSGNMIGEVTSGTMSPVLKKGIGMGYVKTEFSKSGGAIYVVIRNKNLKARIVKTPFINKQ
jgi:aminomethyltransferase